jgi:hypothetical protein
LADSAQWSDSDPFDSNWTDISSAEAQIADAHEQIGEQIGEPFPRKRQPKWIKPLIFALLMATIIGLLTYKKLLDLFDTDKDSSPPLPTTTKTDSEPTDSAP